MRKNEYIHIRVTLEEKEKIKRMALEHGESLTDFIKRKINSKDLIEVLIEYKKDLLLKKYDIKDVYQSHVVLGDIKVLENIISDLSKNKNY